MDAELVLEPRRSADRCASPSVPSAFDQELRHEEQRDAARARRRVGHAAPAPVDDVVGEVVVAPGDEDLLAGDPVAAVALPARRVRLQRAEVGAGLRLGQVHRAGPLAGDQLAADRPLLLGVPCAVSASMAPWFSMRAQAEGHVGRLPHLVAAATPSVLGKPWPPMLGIAGHTVPAGLDELAVGFAKPGGCARRRFRARAPSVSPTRLSGAKTSRANLPPSSSIASLKSAVKSANADFP